MDGNRFIDMATGWASTPLGAAHGEVTQTTVDALWESGIECTDYVAFTHLFPLAEKLVAISPKRLTHVAPDTTGTEAVESAVRLMREASGRHFVITFYGGFHGGNYGTAAAGPLEPSVARGIKQFIGGYIYAPYPYCYRCPFKMTHPDCDLWCLDYIENTVLRYETAADQIAGLLIEPVEGEAGVIIPPDDYFPRLRALCDKHGWYLCADEVQTGFGRTGKMFCMEHWDVEPDVMPLAKALSGGALPIAAVLGSEELLADCTLYLGGTFAWHPAACAGALKGIEVLERDRVLDHVAELERFALDRLGSLVGKYEIVGNVRIKGLYIALEFVKDKVSKEPAKKLTREIHFGCIRRGMVPVHEEGLWWMDSTRTQRTLRDGTWRSNCCWRVVSSFNNGWGRGMAMNARMISILIASVPGAGCLLPVSSVGSRSPVTISQSGVNVKEGNLDPLPVELILPTEHH